MKRSMMNVIVALSLLAPGAAWAEGKQDYKASQEAYLQTAEEYRTRADELSSRKGALNGQQQAIVDRLIRVYGALAETKVALAKAVGAQDWDREERLEQDYYGLKEAESKLWDELDRTKQ